MVAVVLVVFVVFAANDVTAKKATIKIFEINKLRIIHIKYNLNSYENLNTLDRSLLSSNIIRCKHHKHNQHNRNHDLYWSLYKG